MPPDILGQSRRSAAGGFVPSPTRDRPPDINLRSGPQVREYEAIVARIAGMLPGRVLDWGCGHGQISHMLKRRGVDVESYDYLAGSEPSVMTLERYPDVEAHVSGD